jgi:predicted RND superfamily exporter protein
MALSDTNRLSLRAILPPLICRVPGTMVVMVLILFMAALAQIIEFRTGALQLRVDPSEERLLGSDHEGWKFYQYARGIFGNDETILIAVEADDVFSPPTVELVSRLTNRLGGVHGVQNVVSLANVLVIRSTDYGLDIAPAMEKMPKTPEEYKTLRSEVMANPVIADALVSILTIRRTATISGGLMLLLIKLLVKRQAVRKSG